MYSLAVEFLKVTKAGFKQDFSRIRVPCQGAELDMTNNWNRVKKKSVPKKSLKLLVNIKTFQNSAVTFYFH